VTQLHRTALVALLVALLGTGPLSQAANRAKHEGAATSPPAPAAAAQSTAPLPAGTPVPASPQIAGTAWFLMDMDSGQVLAESNADARLEPASLTKILTAHVVFRALKEGRVKLDDQVLVSEKAWRTEGSRTFVDVNARVPLEVLLKGLIVQSGNDAAVALAEHVAGSEETFAKLMNEDARRMGMTSSHFVNSTGLPDPEHYTTARDLAKASEATIREFPEYYPWYAIKEFVHNNIKQTNRNLLLWRDESVDGVKTGHTKTAGYCLVASAKRDGMRLVGVVMGTKGEKVRATEMLNLLNYGFRFYEAHRVNAAGETLAKVRAWKGDPREVALGVAQDLTVTVPRNQKDGISTRMEIAPRVVAPVAKGQALGKVVVERKGQVLREAPLVALEEVPLAGWVRRLIDTILLWFQ
jgi:D-alanyl-D-alanine carboxypeptidase (penicillin-binding protein 5/6)